MDRRCLSDSVITSYPTSQRPFQLEEDWGTVKQRENGERCEGGGRVIVEGAVCVGGEGEIDRVGFAMMAKPIYIMMVRHHCHDYHNNFVLP